MMDEAPQWALDEAAKRAEWSCWEAAQSSYSTTKMAIRAHALTIAKHEQPPVDPDLLLARECAAEMHERLELQTPLWAGFCREGSYDDCTEVKTALIAIRKVRAQYEGKTT